VYNLDYTNYASSYGKEATNKKLLSILEVVDNLNTVCFHSKKNMITNQTNFNQKLTAHLTTSELRKA